jgi:RNA polymerase sigma-70 factor, ECF subfamily
MEKAMRRTLIRYKTKPEASDRNAELISAVFAELEAAKPDGVRYLSLRLDDDTFIHLVEATADDGSTPIPKLAAFQAFQSGIRDRCAEPPLVRAGCRRGSTGVAKNSGNRLRSRGDMTPVPDLSATDDLEPLLVAMRPRLHRYCARMVGSSIDGEDVLQDALIKAVEARPAAGVIHNPEGWMFRIAHNAALDFLRRRKRQDALRSAEEVEMIADELDDITSRQIASTSLRTFMRLRVAQRASVILMDVLGCSLQEVCEIMDYSLAAAKAALHRGRTQLRDLAEEGDDAPPPPLSAADQSRLCAYVASFNARDFDHLRAMLADDVRLELVSKTRLRGKAEVSRYFGNYSKVSDWHLVPGSVEGRPAILVFDPNEPDGPPKYFMLLGWQAGKIASIRDFRHASYVVDGLDYRLASIG